MTSKRERNTKLIHISTKDRLNFFSTESNDCRVQISNHLTEGCMRIVPVNVTLPNSVYNVKAGLIAPLEYGGVSYSVNLTTEAGFYTFDQLSTLLIDKLALAGITLNSIEINEFSKKVDFDFAVDTRIDLNSGSADGRNVFTSLLGFRESEILIYYPDLAVPTFSSPYLANLSGVHNYYVCSHALTHSHAMGTSRKRATNFPVFCHVATGGATFGDYISKEVIDSGPIESTTFSMPLSLSIIDLQLRNDEMELVDLNGLDFTLTLKLYY